MPSENFQCQHILILRCLPPLTLRPPLPPALGKGYLVRFSCHLFEFFSLTVGGFEKKVFPALKANCGRFPDASWRNLNIPFVEFKGPGKERKGVENPISLSHLSWACWLSKGYLLMDVVPIAQKNDEISFLSSIFFLSNPFRFQNISRVTRSINKDWKLFWPCSF